LCVGVLRCLLTLNPRPDRFEVRSLQRAPDVLVPEASVDCRHVPGDQGLEAAYSSAGAGQAREYGRRSARGGKNASQAPLRFSRMRTLACPWRGDWNT
jgi:hypothetical protein